jgi:hypothetical protein
MAGGLTRKRQRSASGPTKEEGEPSPPIPLASEHDLDSFDSGVAALDEWLKRAGQGGTRRKAHHEHS